MAEVNVPNIVRGVVPYDDAHACSDLLFGVLALLVISYLWVVEGIKRRFFRHRPPMVYASVVPRRRS